jgi:hypothetical protein
VVLQLDRPTFCDDFDALPAFVPTPQDAPDPELSQPVFSDESGRRAVLMKWAGWGILAFGVLLCAALTLTLRVHIPLPGHGTGFQQSSGGHISPVPSDRSSATAASTDRAGDTGKTAATDRRAQTEPTSVATSATEAAVRLPAAASPAPTLLPSASASRQSGSPPANGKPHTEKTRNPRAATPNPHSHGRNG